VDRAIFVPERDGPSEQDGHRFVRCIAESQFAGPSVAPEALVDAKALTVKQQPESPPADLTLDRVQTLVRCLLVHAQRDRDVGCLAKRGMLRGIVTLAKVIAAVAAEAGWRAC
jgi:hypothetical protein